MHGIRWTLALLGSGLCLMAGGAPADETEKTFPYLAYVASEEAYTRSGPGLQHYPTQKLPSGNPVEVWRHEAGDWYAIRPPHDSISWVSARHITPLKDGLGKITRDGVASYVGSRLSGAQDTIHVRLERGEIVELLDEPIREVEGEAWCAIAPPAGEFRWISSKLLTSRPPREDLVEGPRLPGIDPARYIEPESTQPTVSGSNRTARRDSSPTAWDGDWEQEVDLLQRELTQRATLAPANWNVFDLKARAGALLLEAKEVEQRRLARGVVAQIAKMEDVYRRYQQSGPLAPFLPGEVPSPAPARELAPQTFTPLPPALEAFQQFDAQGVLRPVVSRRSDAPRYALEDGTGNVNCFLTPGPEVNLQAYVGRLIGVGGARGRIAGLNKPHVQVTRVQVLR